MEHIRQELNYIPLHNVTNTIDGEYSQWNHGDIVFINAGTNTGKSYFIRESLYEHAKTEGERILFVCNRRKLIEQNEEQIKGKEDIITLITYQAIENRWRQSDPVDLHMFKYIVCDESHYFTTDSEFNTNSDLSFNAISNANHGIRIFMTATGDTIFNFIERQYNKTNNNIWKYNIHKDFSEIRAIAFYNKDEVIENFFSKRLKPDEKVLYFCNTIKKAYQLSKKYTNSLFVCSDSSNNPYQNKLDKTAIDKMIQSQKLNHQFVFTTTTLDNGVEFKDETIKYIVCDIRDFDILIQCIGRKRFKTPDDKIFIIIKNCTNGNLNGMLKKLKNTIDKVEIFINYGVDAWIKASNRYDNSDFCIYDSQGSEKHISNKKVNFVKYEKIQSGYRTIKEILYNDIQTRKIFESNGQKYEGNAFINYVCKLLNQNKYSMLDEVFETMELNEYLESIVGKRLYKEDQKELIERLNIRQDGKLMKSITVLNGSMNELKLKYLIESDIDKRRKLEDGSINPNRDKTYWTVCKIVV